VSTNAHLYAVSRTLSAGREYLLGGEARVLVEPARKREREFFIDNLPVLVHHID
jgi:hypothetical protein